jgi:acetoacetyl-CoA synthetase
MESPKALWKPTNPESAPISIYRRHINRRFNQSLKTSQELHRWSVRHQHEFWIDLWDYVGLIPPLPKAIKRAYDDAKDIREIPTFFDGVCLNYAENVLFNRNPDAIALVGLREGQGLDGEAWSWGVLIENVRIARSALVRTGVNKGDRVAALMSNSPWTIALFLATASIGAVFTSISPEMGASGCISRLDQISPTILFADSHQTYKGKRQSMQTKLEEIVEALNRKLKIVLNPFTDEQFVHQTLPAFLSQSSRQDKLEYERVRFSEPLVILYSSGTTGSPKCIVHHHGLVLNHKKIAILHNSLSSTDVVFQYSSTSWVLWNIMIGHLSVGATLICYDGSPLYPDASTKLRILEHYKATYFGTSPRYLLELEMSGINPSQFDLSALRMVTTTGAALTSDQFRWFYRAFPKTAHLSSVAGGTEICTSWLASDPAGPVYAGEMQLPALGHDVDCADPDTGESVKDVSFPKEVYQQSLIYLSRRENLGSLYADHPSRQCQYIFGMTQGTKSIMKRTLRDILTFQFGRSMTGFSSIPRLVALKFTVEVMAL